MDMQSLGTVPGLADLPLDVRACDAPLLQQRNLLLGKRTSRGHVTAARVCKAGAAAANHLLLPDDFKFEARR